MNASNFVKDMVKDPISKTEEISKDTGNKYLKTSIFMIALWMVAKLVYSILSYSKYSTFGKNVLSSIKMTIAPLCIVLALYLIILALNKKNKKPLSTVISVVATAHTPIILASVVNLLYFIDSGMYKITNPVNRLETFITIIFSYFAVKNIFEEDTELASFKKFVLVELIYIGVAFIFSFMGITMYI